MVRSSPSTMPQSPRASASSELPYASVGLTCAGDSLIIILMSLIGRRDPPDMPHFANFKRHMHAVDMRRRVCMTCSGLECGMLQWLCSTCNKCHVDSGHVHVCSQGVFPVLQWQQSLHADHGAGAQHVAPPGYHPQSCHLPTQRQGQAAPQGKPPCFPILDLHSCHY